MTRMADRRGFLNLPLLAGAAAVYAFASWMAAPGFYDGLAPPTPYSFVCPPPIAGPTAAPKPGHSVIPVTNGQSDFGEAVTGDGQVRLSFDKGAFNVIGSSSVVVDIQPASECPNPPGLRFSTNTYLVSASAPLVKPATIVMEYSNLAVDPSHIYRADSLQGPWTNIGAGSQAIVWTINARTDRLGYFAAGYPSTQSSGGNQLLPALLAFIIGAVLLLSIPLAVVRRRRSST